MKRKYCYYCGEPLNEVTWCGTDSQNHPICYWCREENDIHDKYADEDTCIVQEIEGIEVGKNEKQK